MKLNRLAIMSALVVALGMPLSAQPQNMIQVTTQTVVYAADMKDAPWYVKLYLYVKGLNWDEISITTVSAFDSAAKTTKIISVHAWPSDEDEKGAAFHLDSDPDKKSFMHFREESFFRKEEIPRLLELFGFVVDDRTGENKFSSKNLWEGEDDDGSMYCQLQKSKAGPYTFVTQMQTLNAGGKQNGSVEITVNSDAIPRIEKIHAELKIGLKITLTMKDFHSVTDWK